MKSLIPVPLLSAASRYSVWWALVALGAVSPVAAAPAPAPAPAMGAAGTANSAGAPTAAPAATRVYHIRLMDTALPAAHVQLVTGAGPARRVIAEGETSGGVVDLTAPATGAVQVLATAAGYEQRGVFRSDNDDGSTVIVELRAVAPAPAAPAPNAAPTPTAAPVPVKTAGPRPEYVSDADRQRPTIARAEPKPRPAIAHSAAAATGASAVGARRVYKIRFTPSVPVPVHVLLVVPVIDPRLPYRVIAEGDTTGEALELTGPAEADVSVIATAPGYVQRLVINEARERAAEGEAVELTVALSETPAAQSARQERERTDRREAYVAAHPALSPALRAAVLAGQPVARMSVADTEAALGPLQLEVEGGGVGPGLQLYSANEGERTTLLTFADGRLVRWVRR